MVGTRYTSEAALALLGDALEEAASLHVLQWHVFCFEASRLSDDADEVILKPQQKLQSSGDPSNFHQSVSPGFWVGSKVSM